MLEGHSVGADLVMGIIHIPKFSTRFEFQSQYQSEYHIVAKLCEQNISIAKK